MSDPDVITEQPSCLPWLQADWQALYQRHRDKRMPHALLIAGKRGIGKRAFGRFVAASLLCLQPDASQGACGRCGVCQQLAAGSHADFRRLAPEGSGQTIRIDTVRELNDWLYLTAERGSYKLALIDTPESMTVAAANSLLKTLEEPGSAALILLVSDQPGSLPATVRSRCQSLILRLRDPTPAIDWLQGQVDDPPGALIRAGNAPLHAVQEQSEGWLAAEAAIGKAWQDLFLCRASIDRIVKSLEKLSTARCLQRFGQLCTAVVMRRVTGLEARDPAADALARDVQGCLTIENWLTLHDRIRTLYRIDSASFKAQAVLEGLFADIRLRIDA